MKKITYDKKLNIPFKMSNFLTFSVPVYFDSKSKSETDLVHNAHLKIII